MISERKKHIAKIFLNRCNTQNVIKSHLDFFIKLMRETYGASDEFLKKVQEEYSIDNHIERLIPILDKQFSIEELQEAIKFYSSELGRKMLDPIFLNEIDKINRKIDEEIVQKFAKSNE